MIDTGYACKECGKPAVVANGEIIRSCEHKGVVVASMEAVATGEGDMPSED